MECVTAVDSAIQVQAVGKLMDAAWRAATPRSVCKASLTGRCGRTGGGWRS